MWISKVVLPKFVQSSIVIDGKQLVSFFLNCLDPALVHYYISSNWFLIFLFNRTIYPKLTFASYIIEGIFLFGISCVSKKIYGFP